MDLGLKGKLAIVTGTGREGAMGHTIAKQLAAEGADIACVDILIDGAEKIAEEIRGMGVKAQAFKCDQAVYQEVADTAAKIKAEMGTAEILVNNAALLRGGGRIQLTKVEDWQNLMKIDLDGPWYWIRETWDGMLEKGYGRIINISSIAGVMGGYGQANYSCAKGALVSLAKTAALEGARVGITANTVTLGVIEKPVPEEMRKQMEAAGKSPQKGGMFERIKAVIAMKEYGEPADVATLIAFLVSVHAKYITGQDVHVMGGLDLFSY
ncbi:SDR family NAD(P)-dependent oxidoreductase [Chloroflexota bacterium]